jgi:hypothetical protein
MTPPIRTPLHVATNFNPNTTWTLRQAIDWFVAAYAVARRLSPLTQMESTYVNKRWAALMEVVAGQQGVEAGALSYFLMETASAEIALQEMSHETEM